MVLRAALLAMIFGCSAAMAEAPLTALARIDPARSALSDVGQGARVTLALSQPVPWRVFVRNDPPRLVLEFSEVAFGGLDLAARDTSNVVNIAAMGPVRDGWSQMVLDLARPMLVEIAALEAGQLTLSLTTTDEARFAARAESDAALPVPSAVAPEIRRYDGQRPLRVVIDPGHGGIDPGAEAGGLTEAAVILTFAKAFRDKLVAAGMEVTLTREADTFVPLERRVAIARENRADLFLSLHADALAEGRASGATIYTLSTEAQDRATQRLVERHERGALLGGVDLTGHDDQVARVLVEMARIGTAPRSEALANALVEGLARHTGDLHKRPRLRAGFSVLKSPDIPSVLVELGFLSSARDRSNLTSPAWRDKTTTGLVEAIERWAGEDAAQTAGLRP